MLYKFFSVNCEVRTFFFPDNTFPPEWIKTRKTPLCVCVCVVRTQHKTLPSFGRHHDRAIKSSLVICRRRLAWSTVCLTECSARSEALWGVMVERSTVPVLGNGPAQTQLGDKEEKWAPPPNADCHRGPWRTVDSQVLRFNSCVGFTRRHPAETHPLNEEEK